MAKTELAASFELIPEERPYSAGRLTERHEFAADLLLHPVKWVLHYRLLRCDQHQVHVSGQTYTPA